MCPHTAIYVSPGPDVDRSAYLLSFVLCIGRLLLLRPPRCLVYLLYWYKSTEADADDAPSLFALVGA
jgi:hypothetical protein